MGKVLWIFIGQNKAQNILGKEDESSMLTDINPVSKKGTIYTC